ncbi:GntR family transcriptional regulator [Enterovirga rhinocerotis]|uniref:DNA-binding GntR family transcriptional regulator n=1 Tax=Enterovirga rhinocerotis TaxID=1339210 RepID=A0A4R7BW30_9HYPH|nr:GntR family transcriptional regulator [Enterovirga rhinocerotis]TDR90064.1 DNA-binding GntR family transcriptional regulator [Enterovirga rhinocerotis]
MKRFELPSFIAAELWRVLSDEIIFLRLEPGLRLTEEDICGRYGVSRSPVRETFKMLEADGLIVRSARRGVRVAPVSREDLQEVYSCRAALEGLAAASAARNAGPDAHEELRQLVASLEQALAERDVPAFFERNVAVTRAVHRHSGNKTLVRIVDGIEKQALRYRYIAHTRTHEMLETSFVGHQGVCEAIIAGNAPLARRRADRMIRIAHAVIAKALAEAYPAAPDAETA